MSWARCGSSTSSRSFNGAAADQRRKLASATIALRWPCFASMGPPLISGGNLAPVAAVHVTLSASMGPPLISGGNRGQVGVEDQRRSASMGPPLISGGNMEQSKPVNRDIVLQW